jgi:sec-independent protein translocase protein TatC
MAQQAIDPNPNEINSEEGEGMTLLDHLHELRDRVFKAVIALVIGFCIGIAVSQQVLTIIAAPYGKPLQVISPTEGIGNVFTVAITVGAALAMPVIVYELLAFMMPGLLPNEKKWIYLGVPFATILFVTGAAFAWFLFLPSAINFLVNIYPTVFTYNLTPDQYVPFVMGLVFWIGLAFELPLLIFILAKANVVTAHILLKQWRYAIIVIAIAAAMITPTPDPINMSIVMAPLLVLYAVSIGMAALARRGKTTPALLDPGPDTDDPPELDK